MHSEAQHSANFRMANRRWALKSLFEPQGVAVIGASPKPSLAKSILNNIVSFGFDGNIAAVNPKYTSIDGVDCYKSIADVPFHVDLAVLCVRAENLLPILEECKRKSVGAAQIIASGFAELDSREGRARQQQVQRWAEDAATIVVIGPNTFGLLNLHRPIIAVGDNKITKVLAGGVSGVFQSGQMVTVMHPLMSRGIGISKIMTTGNEASVTTAQLINFFADDPQTEVIVSYCEGINDPECFAIACTRARELGKPIIMLRVGAHAEVQKSIKRHTATQGANSYKTDIRFLEDLGVIAVHSVEDLIETVVAFNTCRSPRGKRVAFVSFSGGMGNIVADSILSTPELKLASFSHGLREKLANVLPRFANNFNPLDLSAQSAFDAEILTSCIEVLGQSDEFDILLWGKDLPTSIEDDSVVGVALTKLMAQNPGVVVIPVSQMNGMCQGGESNGNPPMFAGRALLQGTAGSIRALGKVVGWHASSPSAAPTNTISQAPHQAGAI
ncbi:acyl-CoA synthetase (NDP forming) [Bradyrhizobium canariense]|uniref:Acyl-CoA synthetase (NDP forming) n=2 Tax=Bradyrhizobium canariense TaxID=255045 RepID=A0ABX3XBJ6_9BRAD|nr:acyl-CoA synthetase (NDP forming) [Bradyrhizobium canariense]OSJ36572.1 acyl-CoA synthetase (NDP forming) [Bradyrhizobium canariense]